jgi:hypothetical protein
MVGHEDTRRPFKEKVICFGFRVFWIGADGFTICCFSKTFEIIGVDKDQAYVCNDTFF